MWVHRSYTSPLWASSIQRRSCSVTSRAMKKRSVGSRFTCAALSAGITVGVVAGTVAYANGWSGKVLTASLYETLLTAGCRYNYADKNNLCQSMSGKQCSVQHRWSELVLSELSEHVEKSREKNGIFATEVTEMRKNMESHSKICKKRAIALHPLLKFDEIVIDHVPCLFIHKDGQELHELGDQPVVIETHGGSQTAGNYYVSSPLTAEIADQTSIPVISVNYALAPERTDLKLSGVQFESGHQHIDQVSRVVSWLNTESNVPLSKIGIIGDSAGGNTAMATLAHTHQKFEKDLGACVCISGWLDLNYTKEGQSKFPYPSHSENLKYDCFVSSDKSAPGAAAYIVAFGSDAESRLAAVKSDEEIFEITKDPMISPINASYQGLASRVLLIASEFEYLRDHSVEMHKKLNEQGVMSELRLIPSNIHSLPVLTHIPESKQEVAYISRFLCNSLN